MGAWNNELLSIRKLRTRSGQLIACVVSGSAHIGTYSITNSVFKFPESKYSKQLLVNLVSWSKFTKRVPKKLCSGMYPR